MTTDPFSGAGFSFLGGQLAQAWQRGLEIWWRALLDDPVRLGALAEKLAEMGLGKLSPATDPDASDYSRALLALELMENRLQALEGRIEELAKKVESMSPGRGRKE